MARVGKRIFDARMLQACEAAAQDCLRPGTSKSDNTARARVGKRIFDARMLQACEAAAQDCLCPGTSKSDNTARVALMAASDVQTLLNARLKTSLAHRQESAEALKVEAQREEPEAECPETEKQEKTVVAEQGDWDGPEEKEDSSSEIEEDVAGGSHTWVQASPQTLKNRGATTAAPKWRLPMEHDASLDGAIIDHLFQTDAPCDLEVSGAHDWIYNLWKANEDAVYQVHVSEEIRQSRASLLRALPEELSAMYPDLSTSKDKAWALRHLVDKHKGEVVEIDPSQCVWQLEEKAPRRVWHPQFDCFEAGATGQKDSGTWAKPSMRTSPRGQRQRQRRRVGARRLPISCLIGAGSGIDARCLAKEAKCAIGSARARSSPSGPCSKPWAIGITRRSCMHGATTPLTHTKQTHGKLCQ